MNDAPRLTLYYYCHRLLTDIGIQRGFHQIAQQFFGDFLGAVHLPVASDEEFPRHVDDGRVQSSNRNRGQANESVECRTNVPPTRHGSKSIRTDAVKRRTEIRVGVVSSVGDSAVLTRVIGRDSV